MRVMIVRSQERCSDRPEPKRANKSIYLSVINKVLEGDADFGYDAKSDAFVNMLEAGIIDPKKVTRVALENAASVSGMILPFPFR